MPQQQPHPHGANHTFHNFVRSLRKLILRASPRFWNRDWTLAIVILIALFAFVSLWYFNILRPYLVPVGAALGTFFAAIPGIVSPTMKGKLLPAIVASLVVGTGTWYTTFNLEREKQSLEVRHHLMQSSFLNYSKTLGPESKSQLLIKLSLDLRQQFAAKEYDYVEEISGLVLEISPDNGHGLYYSGEVWRVRGNQEQMRGQFNRYRSVEKLQPLDQRKIKGSDCYYLAPIGFCGERTGWVDHMQANNFYQRALGEKEQGTKVSSLKTACGFVRESFDRYPSGFDASKSFYSTEDLQERILKDMATLLNVRPEDIGPDCLPTKNQ